jgi:cell division transport system permease protein
MSAPAQKIPAVGDAISTELRITGRIFQETWGGIVRSGWMNVVILVTMAAILSIFGTLLAFVIETELLFDHLGTGFEVSVYLRPDASVNKVKTRLLKHPGVEKVQVVTKEQAWSELKEALDIERMDNPLPHAIHVKSKNPKQVEALATELEAMEGIEEVNYAKQLIQKMRNFSNVVSAVGLLIAVFLGVMTMFVISNTIHLLIEARSREIEILRMMGVGNWYIRLPFLFQGAAYGLCGALIAYFPLLGAVYSLGELFNKLQFSSSGYSLNIVFVIMLLMGVIVGAGGAANSIRKYLQV